MTAGKHKGIWHIGGLDQFTLNFWVRLWWMVPYRPESFILIKNRLLECVSLRTVCVFWRRETTFFLKGIVPRYFVLAACAVWATRTQIHRTIDENYVKYHGACSVSINRRLFSRPRKILLDETLTNAAVFTIPSTRAYTSQFIPDHEFAFYVSCFHFNIIHLFVSQVTRCLEYYHISESHRAACYAVKTAWQVTWRYWFFFLVVHQAWIR
jgi:hypothetical protein